MPPEGVGHSEVQVSTEMYELCYGGGRLTIRRVLY